MTGGCNVNIRLCNSDYRKRKWHPSAQPSRVSESLSLMSWLACPRTSFHLLNPTRRQFSFSFRLRFPRDLSVPPRLRNPRLQSGAVPSFLEQVARSSPVPCFADAVRHPEIGKHIMVRKMDTLCTRCTLVQLSLFRSLCWVLRRSCMSSLPTTPMPRRTSVGQRRWGTAAPTTSDMRFAQAQLLLNVRQFLCHVPSQNSYLRTLGSPPLHPNP